MACELPRETLTQPQKAELTPDAYPLILLGERYMLLDESGALDEGALALVMVRHR